MYSIDETSRNFSIRFTIFIIDVSLHNLHIFTFARIVERKGPRSNGRVNMDNQPDKIMRALSLCRFWVYPKKRSLAALPKDQVARSSENWVPIWIHENYYNLWSSTITDSKSISLSFFFFFLIFPYICQFLVSAQSRSNDSFQSYSWFCGVNFFTHNSRY